MLKFNEPGEPIDMPLVEHATMTLAAQAGICAARTRTRAVPLHQGHVVAAGGLHRVQMHELFRRMVFNILIDNTDDHEMNHAFLMTDSGEYALSPAFDVLPSGQALGYQQMRQVCEVVAQWSTHFAGVGVTVADIDALAGQIDRLFLRQQREVFIQK